MADEQTMKLCADCAENLDAEKGGPYWLQQVSEKELHGCSLCDKDYKISHVYKYESRKARQRRLNREWTRAGGAPRQKDTRARYREPFWPDR